jgi:hypothetical protein
MGLFKFRDKNYSFNKFKHVREQMVANKIRMCNKEVKGNRTCCDCCIDAIAIINDNRVWRGEF